MSSVLQALNSIAQLEHNRLNLNMVTYISLLYYNYYVTMLTIIAIVTTVTIMFTMLL